MLFGSLFRNDDGKHQVYRLVIRRFEIDRFLQTEKTTDSLIQIRHAGMRHRKSLAEAGTAQPFAAQQIVVNGGLRKLDTVGNDVGNHFQQLLFTGDFSIDKDFLGRQKRRNCHLSKAVKWQSTWKLKRESYSNSTSMQV